MAKHFFVIHDGESLVSDEDGANFPDEEAAANEATLSSGNSQNPGLEFAGRAI